MDSEFTFLEHLRNHFKLEKAGDDCAVFPKDASHDYLISSDMLVQRVDFKLEWTTPALIGHKALAVSISDIAAMGGIPRFSMVSMGVPESLWKINFPENFYDGYMALAKRFEIELIGGDISRTPDLVTIDSTVIGEVPKGKAVYRNGAKPGDDVFVTGALGGAAAGLKLLEQGNRYGEPYLDAAGKDVFVGKDTVLRKQLAPSPPEGSRFVGQATAMIDISDGLSTDLTHLCMASGVGATIYSEKIPVESLDPSMKLTKERLFELALHGGEDYELLFSADPGVFSGDEEDIVQIGEITTDVGNINLITDGESLKIEPGGYSHF